MAWITAMLTTPRWIPRVIGLGVTVVVGSGVFPTAVAAGVSPEVASDPGTGGTAPVRPFHLDQVRLNDGLLQEKRDLIKEFLHEYDERRFLILFNDVANRTNPEGISVPGGWEEGGLLSGHWTGHFMSALSQAYSDQGEPIFKDKLDWMVTELAACQDAISDSMGIEGDSTSTHPGYLGAIPEDTVLRLGPPRWAVYGPDPDVDTWAPWYTQHKIMRGLLDAYYNTNNTQALDIAVRMAQWAHLALTIGDKSHPDYAGNLTREDLNSMWDLHIAGEYGGANEVFAEVYELTGDDRHLETARAFDNRASLFDASVEDNDILVVTPENNPGPRRAERLHANTHVPQYLGYLRVYEQSWDREYMAAAKNFYGWVVPHRGFASGGTGGNYPGSNDNSELFQNRDNIANAISDAGAETCTTYNMIKLARNLFLHEQDASYMDYYERGLLNMIAGSRADESSVDDPLLTYFQPLTPGTAREYGNTGTCCGGTGMESHTKYQDTVYFRSADESTLWINLYVPSTLTWWEKGFTVKQETDFPRGDRVILTVGGGGPLDIKLRVPAWAGQGFEVSVNGEAQGDEGVNPGTYYTLSRTWIKGDVIEIRIPLSIQIERALDRPDTQAVMWGPVLLQILGSPGGGNGTENGTSNFWELSLYKYLKLNGDYSRAAIEQTGTTPRGDPLFTTGDGSLTLRPYYISDTQPASSYFRRVEPEVVFGEVDTGVPNRKWDDGLPNYDVPVDGVPSPGTGGPTFLDLIWDQAPFSTHEEFVEVVTEVAGTFVNAGVYTAEERDVIVTQAKEAEHELDPGRAP